MIRPGKNNIGHIPLVCFKMLAVIFALLLSERDTASAMDRIKPSLFDFAICELSAEQKEKFLDEHNKFRGMVDPAAADMEYLVSRASQVLSFKVLAGWKQCLVSIFTLVLLSQAKSDTN